MNIISDTLQVMLEWGGACGWYNIVSFNAVRAMLLKIFKKIFFNNKPITVLSVNGIEAKEGAVMMFHS